MPATAIDLFQNVGAMWMLDGNIHPREETMPLKGPVASFSLMPQASPTFLARITDDEGVPLTQGQLASISWSVYIHENGQADRLKGSGSSDIPSTFFDTLQPSNPQEVDEIWGDSIGYNFRATLANTPFDEDAEMYHVIFSFTRTNGEVINAQYNCKAHHSPLGT